MAGVAYLSLGGYEVGSLDDQIRQWPETETLEGRAEIGFRRAHELIASLKGACFQKSALFAPRNWISADGTFRSDYYQAQQKLACEMQDQLLRGYTPKEGVPLFAEAEAEADGNSGIWNFHQPVETKVLSLIHI